VASNQHGDLGTGVVAPGLPLLLRISEVAAQLGINRATVYDKLIRPGVLPTVVIGVRSRRVARRDLEAYVEHLREGNGSGGRDGAA
jgi:excisionase family DNA binding protein